VSGVADCRISVHEVNASSLREIVPLERDEEKSRLRLRLRREDVPGISMPGSGLWRPSDFAGALLQEATVTCIRFL
jgi:hypothetical protein